MAKKRKILRKQRKRDKKTLNKGKDTKICKKKNERNTETAERGVK